MLMRKKPLRGEKYKCADGTEVIVVEPFSDLNGSAVKVILPNGKLGSRSKGEPKLPMINTKDYEKI